MALGVCATGSTNRSDARTAVTVAPRFPQTVLWACWFLGNPLQGQGKRGSRWVPQILPLTSM